MKLLRNLAIAIFWTSLPFAVITFSIFISNHDKAMARAYAGK